MPGNYPNRQIYDIVSPMLTNSRRKEECVEQEILKAGEPEFI
jgi:hypothetical protein